jgi:hypothetical protein
MTMVRVTRAVFAALRSPPCDHLPVRRRVDGLPVRQLLTGVGGPTGRLY